MNYLPAGTTKIIAMKRVTHAKRSETLAEYYYRVNRHLLKGIILLEIDTDTNMINVIKEN